MPFSAMPFSAMPFSAMPFSAMPFSAMPFSAMPFSAMPMFPTSSRASQLRSLPKVHTLLGTGAARTLLSHHPRPVVLDAIREQLDALRRELLSGQPSSLFSEDAFFAEIGRRLQTRDLRRLQRVINATGIIIHTNMGRVPLAESAAEAAASVARNYSNLELDLDAGKRGSRGGQIEELFGRITGAEAALVVNNNAAAVLLALTTVAQGGEVILSRGELVEIGGGFRVPDVIRQSGARLVEVGTTNKTRLSDYAGAITPETKALLKVHASNYRIIGFTEETPLPAVVRLGQESDLPVMSDLGSGALIDVRAFGLPYEPTVSETLQTGVDIATVSGDKLLGGPQCGIIAGKSETVRRLAGHPLFRALRADKMTLAALEATLRLYLDTERLAETLPVLQMLSQTKEHLTRRARRLRAALAKVPGLEVHLRDGNGYTGGGALPTVPLPTKWVQIRSAALSVEQIAGRLRRHDPPVMAMLESGWLTLDVRTLRDDEIRELVTAMQAVVSYN